MNKEEYKVEGDKETAKKLSYLWMFFAIWPFIHLALSYVVVDCSPELYSCSQEQIYALLYFQTFTVFPIMLFVAYVGYYSLKVLIQKQIPPKGNTFPYTIPKVIYRDHYTFGIAGVILSGYLIYLFVHSVYLTYNITSI